MTHHYRIIFDIETDEAIDTEELIQIASVMGTLTNDTIPSGTVTVKAGEVQLPQGGYL